MSQIVKQSWIYRKRINLMLGTLALSSTGYLFLRYQQDRRFQHPLVQEVLRLMERNSQVVELIGYPLGTKIGLRSVFDIDSDMACLYFHVKGPKGGLLVDVQASRKELKDIKGSEELKKYFYVPEQEVYEKMKEARGNEEELRALVLNDSDKFWKLECIFADLAGQYRISVHQNEEERILRVKNHEQQIKSSSSGEQPKTRESLAMMTANKNQAVQSLVTPRENYLDLWKEHKFRFFKENLDASTLSDTEQEERRRFRLNQLYQKIGYVRFWMFGIFLFGGMGTYIYVMKNKRKSIINSQIHLESMALIKKSALAKNLFGQVIRFSTGVRGAQVDKEAEFDMDIIGDKFNGIAKVKGTQKDNGFWAIDQVILEQKSNDGKIIQQKKLF